MAVVVGPHHTAISCHRIEHDAGRITGEPPTVDIDTQRMTASVGQASSCPGSSAPSNRAVAQSAGGVTVGVGLNAGATVPEFSGKTF